MHVLKNHQDRSKACQRFHLRSQRFQRSLSPLLRGQFEGRITPIVRQRQHLGKQRSVVGGRRALGQQGIEFVQSRLRCIVVRETGGALHLTDDRVQDAVSVLR